MKKQIALYFVLATLALVIANVSSNLLLTAIYTSQAKLVPLGGDKDQPKIEIKAGDQAAAPQEHAGAEDGAMKPPSSYKTGVSYDKAMKDNKLAVVEFYADWCPHCQRLAPIYHEVSKKFDGKVNFVAINSEDAASKDLVKEYNIQYFPSVFIVNPKTKKKEQIDSSLVFEESTFIPKVQGYVDSKF